MAEDKPRPKRKQKFYSQIERDGILTLVFHYGNHAAERETGCASDTVAQWRRKYPDEWLRICEREGPIMEKRIVAQTQEAMARIGEVEIRAIQRVAENLEDLSPRELADLASAQQRFAMAKGVNGTKLLELTGRPTQVIENRSGADLLRELARMAPGLIVDSTAVEIEPAKEIAPPD